jgi:exonuclease VII small subunit
METGISIEKKVKQLAFGAAVTGVLTAVFIVIFLFIVSEPDAVAIGVSAGVGIVVALIGFFAVFSTASNISAETKKDASALATAASAMAVGNFSAALRTEGADELGQIEGAMAQLLLVQKELTKDIENFARRQSNGEITSLIDDKPYAGSYREMVKNINSIAAAHATEAASLEEAVNMLEHGDFKGRMPSKQLDNLRLHLEKMSREVEAAQTAEVAAKNELTKTKEDLANAKRDADSARTEASMARSDAATAERELTTARREAERAKGEAARLNDRLKTTGIATPGTRTAMSPLPAGTPTALKTMYNSPTPSPRPRSILDGAPSAIKSVKINAPSGAHVYDRKDFGKF